MSNTPRTYHCRSGESEAEQFERSGRFFCIKGNWFFKTREGVDYGPFHNRTECKYAYEEFIEVVSNHEELGGIPVDFNDSAGDFKIPKINFN